MQQGKAVANAGNTVCEEKKTVLGFDHVKRHEDYERAPSLCEIYVGTHKLTFVSSPILDAHAPHHFPCSGLGVRLGKATRMLATRSWIRGVREVPHALGRAKADTAHCRTGSLQMRQDKS